MIALVTVAVFIYRKPFQHLFSAVGYGVIGSRDRADASLARAGRTLRGSTRDVATATVPGFAAYRAARWARRNPGQAAGLAAGIAVGGAAAAGAAAGAARTAQGSAAGKQDQDAAGVAAAQDGSPPDLAAAAAGGAAGNGAAGNGTDAASGGSRPGVAARARSWAASSGDATGRSAPPLNLPSRDGSAAPAGRGSNGHGPAAGRRRRPPATAARQAAPPRVPAASPAACPRLAGRRHGQAAGIPVRLPGPTRLSEPPVAAVPHPAVLPAARSSCCTGSSCRYGSSGRAGPCRGIPGRTSGQACRRVPRRHRPPGTGRRGRSQRRPARSGSGRSAVRSSRGQPWKRRPASGRRSSSLVVLGLAGLGIFLVRPGASGSAAPAQSPSASRSPAATASPPPAVTQSPAATPAPSTAPAPAPGSAGTADIYQWLPFTPSELTSRRGGYPVRRSLRDLLLHRERDRIRARMRNVITSQLSEVLARAYATPGVAGPRARQKQVSAATVEHQRAARVRLEQHHVHRRDRTRRSPAPRESAGAPRSTPSPLTGSGGSWQVSDIELASAGNA